MARILNIETATDICSVCISDGTDVLAIKESDQEYSHASAITLLIESCTTAAGLALKDLDAIAVSQGPGSYTALRVGAATAKGICYALDKPLIAVDTLAALAYASKQDFPGASYYIPMIDARRMEVYTAVFDANLQCIKPVHNLILDEQSFSSYFDSAEMIVFGGNGAPKSKTVLTQKEAVFSEVRCSASHMVPLALQALQKQAFSDIAYYTPQYFKAPNITVSKKTL